MVRHFAHCLVVALAGSLAGNAKADVMIDDYTVPTPAAFFFITQTPPNPYDRTDFLPGGVIRSLHVEVTIPTVADPNSANGQIGAGVLDFSVGATAAAFARLTYTGSYDFTGNNAFRLT